MEQAMVDTAPRVAWYWWFSPPGEVRDRTSCRSTGDVALRRLRPRTRTVHREISQAWHPHCPRRFHCSRVCHWLRYRCYANYFTPAIDREVSPFYAIAHSGGNYVFTLFRCLSRCPDVCPVTTWTRPHGCLVGRVHYTHAPVEASGDCGRSCFFITTFAAMLRCLTVLVTVAKLGETVALAAIVKQLS